MPEFSDADLLQKITERLNGRPEMERVSVSREHYLWLSAEIGRAREDERNACLAIVASVHNELKRAASRAFGDGGYEKSSPLEVRAAVASLIGANINERSGAPKPLSSFTSE